MNIDIKGDLYFSQLWEDRTCLVNLGIDKNICKNLTSYENYTNQVQAEVSRLQIVGNNFIYFPEIIMGIILGILVQCPFLIRNNLFVLKMFHPYKIKFLIKYYQPCIQKTLYF